ncbi:MAG: hypothetical protein MUE69_16980 [Myxococcota bacterium]|nr:hypothetical protein [Myxococcota bacterium]
MTIFTPSRPHDVRGGPRGQDTASSSLGPSDAGPRWLDWLSKKLFDVDALDLELTREDLPNAPGEEAQAPTDRGPTPEVGS